MPVPLLSFFTGGGFLDKGFEQAGFDIVWTNEIDPAFAEMHKHGMSEWRKSVGSTRGTLKKCVNSQAVHPLSEQHGLKARERRYTAHEEGKHWE